MYVHECMCAPLCLLKRHCFVCFVLFIYFVWYDNIAISMINIFITMTLSKEREDSKGKTQSSFLAITKMIKWEEIERYVWSNTELVTLIWGANHKAVVIVQISRSKICVLSGDDTLFFTDLAMGHKHYCSMRIPRNTDKTAGVSCSKYESSQWLQLSDSPAHWN